MRLYVLSDLHLEFAPFDPPAVDADIVVLAGDIDLKQKGLDWARAKFPDRPVVYVLGNHEFYGEALPKHTEALKARATGSNVRILENDAVVIGDVVFLGCTLWTDFRLYGDPVFAGFEASQRLTDYRKVRVSPQYRKLRPVDTATLHQRSLRWLKEESGQRQGQRIVVVTHHAPSRRSLSEAHKDDLLSAAYASNLDDFVAESGAALWVHGHTHVARDYKLGGTRVICNPRGYPDEPNPDFRPDCIIEL